MSRRLVVAAASAAASLVFAGPAPAHVGTTNPAATVPIKVTLTDSAIRMSPSSATRGVAALFVVTNRGTKLHTVVVKDIGTGKRPGFTATLRPDQQKTYVMFLDYRGYLHCASPGRPALTCRFRVT